MASPCVPDRGDVVWLEFNPPAGHEQAGRRPALVLSPAAYNGRTGLLPCCPITSREIPVGDRTEIQGVVLSDQLESLDWRARNAQPKGRVHASVVLEVAARLRALLP